MPGLKRNQGVAVVLFPAASAAGGISNLLLLCFLRRGLRLRRSLRGRYFFSFLLRYHWHFSLTPALHRRTHLTSSKPLHIEQLDPRAQHFVADTLMQERHAIIER